MKLPLSWLRDHLDFEADADTVAETLTRIGLEVEGIDNPAEALRPFRVAKVLTAERHPQADKLQVLTVDAGDGEALQVVCGAPNARAGMLGVFGGPGTYVPGSDFTLKKAAIRGVESNGMMCSSRELMLGDDHDGIIELPADAPVGESFADYAALDDPVLDVNVTPNRPDCLGIDGIARDLAAAGLGTLKEKPVDAVAGRFAPTVDVSIADGVGCWIFWRRQIRGVTNGPSACGRFQRWSTSPISFRSIRRDRFTCMTSPSCAATSPCATDVPASHSWRSTTRNMSRPRTTS
jgi:phenylalanyl-tRNA synthetase beta chain